MVFLDYAVQKFVIRNSNAQTFTAPYKCMVLFSDLRYDDENDFNITIADLIPVQSGGKTTHLLGNRNRFSDNTNNNEHLGSYILRSGQRLILNSSDDFDVEIHYFRLPEAP